MTINKKYIGIGIVSAVVVAAIVTPLVIMKTGNANGSEVSQTSKTGNTPTKIKNGDREADKNNNGDLGEDTINWGDPEADRTRRAEEAERTTKLVLEAKLAKLAQEAKRRIAQAAEQRIRDEEAEGTNNGDSGGERTNNGDSGGERTNNRDSGGERTNNGNPESATTVASQCADSSECTGDKLCVRDDSNSPTSCIAASSLSRCDDQEVLCPQSPKSPFNTSCQMTNDIYDVAHTSHPQCLCLGSDSTKIEDNGSGSIRTCETRCSSQNSCTLHYLCKKDPISKTPYCVAEGVATVCNSDIICGGDLTCLGTLNPVKCICPENQATLTRERLSGSSTICFQKCANTSDCETDQTLCHEGGELADLGPVCKLRSQMDNNCTGVECYANMVCNIDDFDCGCERNEKLKINTVTNNGNTFGTCHAKCTTGCTGGCGLGEYCTEPVDRNPDPGVQRMNNGNSGGVTTNNGNPETPTSIASPCADSSKCPGDELCVRDYSTSPTYCTAASSLSRCDDKEEVLCPKYPEYPFSTRCLMTVDKLDMQYVGHAQCLCQKYWSTKIVDSGSGSIRTCEKRCTSPSDCAPNQLCIQNLISKDYFCIANDIPTDCSHIICGGLICMDSPLPVKCTCGENYATVTIGTGNNESYTTCLQRCANTSDCDADRTLCHDGGRYEDLGRVCKQSYQMDRDCTGVECFKNMVCDSDDFDCGCDENETLRATITKSNGKNFGTCHAKCTTGCTDGCRGGYCAEPVKR